MAYDIKCEVLAAEFLQDEPELFDRKEKLAQTIQTAIEDWIAREKKPKTEVFSRPECIFHYCPHPARCADSCVNKF